MEQEEIQTALKQVRSEEDLNVKALLLAALASSLFRDAGFEAVVVGGMDVDWSEVERIAALPAYNCLEELNALRTEVSAALAGAEQKD